jgi:uridine kinase
MSKVKIVIGVTGFSGSGKTHLCESIKDLYPKQVQLIQQDNYYFGCEPEKADDYNFDQISALDIEKFCQDLRSLKQGKDVEMPLYDFKLHKRVSFLTVCPREILLLEGHLVFLEEKVRRMLDLLLFLDVEPVIALLRRIRRDITSRGRDIAEILNRYERFVIDSQKQTKKLMELSDLTVSYHNHNERALKVITAFIAQKLCVGKIKNG